MSVSPRMSAPEGRLEAFDAVRDEWRALFGADTAATPYGSPDWAAPWLVHWLEGARPYVLAFREGGDLVGVAPLVRGRRGPARVLSGLGTSVGNYWDVVAAPGRREAVVDAFVDALGRRRGEWDALVLNRLPPGSPTERRLAAELRVHRHRPTVSPGLSLPDSFEEYLASRSKNARYRIRHALRPLERGEIEVTTVDDPSRLPAAIAAWQELRTAWWAERGRSMNPEHASSRFRAFVTDAALSLVPRGLAVVWELRRAGEVVGVSINFVDSRAFYYWLGGYDHRFEKLRLGHLVITQGIRTSIEAGRTCFDFMLGDEKYKYDYGAEDRVLPWLVVGHDGLRSRGACAAANAVRARHDARVASDGPRPSGPPRRVSPPAALPTVSAAVGSSPARSGSRRG